MKKKKLIAGVDIGGTKTLLGLVDAENNIIKSHTFKTNPKDGVDAFIEKLVINIQDTLDEYLTSHHLAGIGLAAPSANFQTGIIEDSANLKWQKVNLVELMKKFFDIPIILINDANAAALGEQIFGAAKGMKNFIVLTLGTGLGSGIVVDGNLISGENGLAGELGHVIIRSNGRKCNCGKYGCLETYISANGLCRTVFDLICYHNEDSELKNISFNNLSSEHVSEFAQKNDPIAVKAFELTGEIFGQALSNIVTYFDPQAIILSGGLAEAGDLLLKPTKFYFEKNLLNIYKGKLQILKSNLENGKAAVLGASSFARREIKKIAMDTLKKENEIKV